jgi:transposase
MQVRDHFGEIYEDQSFAALFSTRGQPAEVQWRLVCIFQFIEGLADAIEPRSHHYCPLSDHRG